MPNGKPLYKCKVCGKESEKGGVRNHIEAIHMELSVQEICSQITTIECINIRYEIYWLKRYIQAAIIFQEQGYFEET